MIVFGSALQSEIFNMLHLRDLVENQLLPKAPFYTND